MLLIGKPIGELMPQSLGIRNNVGGGFKHVTRRRTSEAARLLALNGISRRPANADSRTLDELQAVPERVSTETSHLVRVCPRVRMGIKPVRPKAIANGGCGLNAKRQVPESRRTARRRPEAHMELPAIGQLEAKRRRVGQDRLRHSDLREAEQGPVEPPCVLTSVWRRMDANMVES